MTTLEVFDRPLCCSTGICGPTVDPTLIHFAADLDWLANRGVAVHRYNLAFEPAAFTQHDDVTEALRAGQVGCLPVVRVDGQIVSQGRYPGRTELAAWCGVEAGAEPSTPPTGDSPSCCG